MKITYQIDVTKPEQYAGKIGNVRELEDHVARRLIAEGYVKPYEEQKSGRPVDSTKDSGSD